MKASRNKLWRLTLENPITLCGVQSNQIWVEESINITRYFAFGLLIADYRRLLMSTRVFVEFENTTTKEIISCVDTIFAAARLNAKGTYRPELISEQCDFSTLIMRLVSTKSFLTDLPEDVNLDHLYRLKDFYREYFDYHETPDGVKIDMPDCSANEPTLLKVLDKHNEFGIVFS